MNEIDFVLVVLGSSGAGYLVGKHYERQKANRAFHNFTKTMTQQTMATVNGIMDVVKVRLPDLDPKILMTEIVASCAKYGAQVVAYNPVTKHMISNDDNKT